jgi:hypothetical protein
MKCEKKPDVLKGDLDLPSGLEDMSLCGVVVNPVSLTLLLKHNSNNS